MYDRITLFSDHLVRDIDGGRFPENSNVVIVTHGLTLRIFLARWLHWTARGAAATQRHRAWCLSSRL